MSFLKVGTVKSAELRHYAKFYRNRTNRGRDIAIFGFCKMASAVILDFNFFYIFNGRNGQEAQTASLCQISSKSLEPRPRYISSNIMLVWLENAYSRIFWGVLGAHFHQMMSLIVVTPKKDRPWAEPRHLSHKPRKSVARFELGVGTRKKDRTGKIVTKGL